MQPSKFSVMRKTTHVVWSALALLGWVPIPLALASVTRFIPTTQENPHLGDGAPLPEKQESIGWQREPYAENEGTPQSVTDPDKSSTILLMNDSGLEPGANYEVFGCFLAENAPAEDTPSQQHSTVQFGLSLASLHSLAGLRPNGSVANEPWIVTPGYKTGEGCGYEAAVEERGPLPNIVAIPPRKGSYRLIRSWLGCSRTGKDDTLPVFIGAYSSFQFSGSASVAGVALRPADPNSSLDHIWKPGTRPHLAIRAGDSVTFWREVEAEAGVNALDEENLTPLFYATACGDEALVRKLLELGTKPDLGTQSVSPLIADSSHASLTRKIWDMVVFLIDGGYPIISLDSHHFTTSDGIILSRTVIAGPEALPAVKALLRRGVSCAGIMHPVFSHLHRMVRGYGGVGLHRDSGGISNGNLCD
jgi:hypothetical protein